jgi:hypothetical protein
VLKKFAPSLDCNLSISTISHSDDDLSNKVGRSIEQTRRTSQWVSTQTHPDPHVDSLVAGATDDTAGKMSRTTLVQKCALEGMVLDLKTNGQEGIIHCLVDFRVNKSKILGDLSNQHISKLVSVSKNECLDAFASLEKRQRFQQPFPPEDKISSNKEN